MLFVGVVEFRWFAVFQLGILRVCADEELGWSTCEVLWSQTNITIIWAGLENFPPPHQFFPQPQPHLHSTCALCFFAHLCIFSRARIKIALCKLAMTDFSELKQAAMDYGMESGRTRLGQLVHWTALLLVPSVSVWGVLCYLNLNTLMWWMRVCENGLWARGHSVQSNSIIAWTDPPNVLSCSAFSYRTIVWHWQQTATEFWVTGTHPRVHFNK